MTKLNQAIWGLPMPDRIKRLPISTTGFPVPWFVAKINGEWDFRVVGPDKMVQAVKRRLCWVCGQPMGVYMAFTIGPMCAINRVIAEPPSHLECADYSARACPFMTRPNARRNEKDLPENRVAAAGKPIMRNPGAVCVWVTKSATVRRAHLGNDGVLFYLGEPENLLWFAEGRTATRAEVDHSIETGLEILLKAATEEGVEAVEDLWKMIERVKPLLPKERS
jgi:hypothetical protein